MTARLVPLLYGVAIAAFFVGAVLRVLGEEAVHEALKEPGEVVCIAAWAGAALGALIDVVRHRLVAHDD